MKTSEWPPVERVCSECNGAGHIVLVDLGDGVLLTPTQAKSRREADERISKLAEKRV